MKKEDGRIVETTMEARGAERGPTVRNVLVWSTGLVVIGFAAVYLLYFQATSNPTGHPKEHMDSQADQRAIERDETGSNIDESNERITQSVSSEEVDIGSREENASKKHSLPVLIQSEAEWL